MELQGIEACFSEELQERYLSLYKLDLGKAYFGQIEDEIFERQVEMQIRYLRFLVANGYIDEKFIEYTSNYKAQLITQRDAQFVADVQIKLANFDYIADNVQSVIARLDEEDFKHASIINKSLLDNLGLIEILDGKEHTCKFKNLISLLAKSKKAFIWEAIQKYIAIATNQAIEKLLKEIISLRPDLCTDLINADNLENDKIDLVVTCAIKYGGQDYQAQNKNNILAKFLSNHEDYLNLFETAGIKNSIEVLRVIKPVIKKLTPNKQNNEIQKFIIDNDMYEISLHNLEVILAEGEVKDLHEDFYTRNYGFIMASEKECVIRYINSNMDAYSSSVLLNEKVTFENETQELVEILLKNEVIDIENRKAIAMKSKIRIVDLSNFEAKLYPTLINENKIENTWANVIIAYSKIGYEGIARYITEHSLKGSFSWNGDDESINTPLALFSDLIALELMTTDKAISQESSITEILKTVDVQYSISQFDIKGMLEKGGITNGSISNENKMLDINFSKAIELGIIKYEKNDLQRMVSLPISLIAYLKKYETEIISEFDTFFDCVIPQVIGQRVFENNQWVDKKVFQVKPGANALIGVIVGANGVSRSIKAKLIETCLPIVEIQGYEKNYANYYIEGQIAVPTKILWQFTSINLDERDKVALLSLSLMSGIDMKQELESYKAYFQSIGKEWKKVYESKEAYIVRDESTDQLLKALQNKGLLRYKKSNKKSLGSPTFVVAAV